MITSKTYKIGMAENSLVWEKYKEDLLASLTTQEMLVKE